MRINKDLYKTFTPVEWLLASILFIGVVVALTGCSKSGAPQKGDTVTELRYQAAAGMVTLPELAEDLGYLAPLKLNYVGSVQGGPQDIQALITGAVDFASAFNGAFVKAAAAKVNLISVIGSYGRDQKSWAGYYVLADSPIKNVHDLIGKKVGVNTLGAHFEFALKDYLARGGLTPAEIQKVELVVLPPVNTEQALRAKQIDVAVLPFILRDKALERGGIRQIFADTDMYGDFTAGTHAVTPKFAKEHPEAVRQFVSGTAKAIEWAKSTPEDQVKARLIAIINKRHRNESTGLVQYWHSFGVAEQGGLVTAKQFQPWIDLMVKNGELKAGQVNADKLFSNDFNSYAKATTATTTAKTGEK